ncbi:MAG: histone H1 [Ignavibacteriaceae bacterium]|nr:histone H1 [Ignavibacteriaceae bacterium]NUM70575.1 histone H1 [Ignavibacteriaceae bacterium]
MQKYQDLLNLIQSMENDVKRYYEKGPNNLSVKLRKSLLDVRSLAQELRGEILEIKNQRKAAKKK